MMQARGTCPRCGGHESYECSCENHEKLDVMVDPRDYAETQSTIASLTAALTALQAALAEAVARAEAAEGRVKVLEEVLVAGRFLSERLESFEPDDADAPRMTRDFYGHVVPAHERFMHMLAALPAELEAARAERDALIGAAYEAGVAQARLTVSGHMDWNPSTVRDDLLINIDHSCTGLPDATAALATIRAEAFKAGMMRAAGIADKGRDVSGWVARDAIIAAAEYGRM